MSEEGARPTGESFEYREAAWSWISDMTSVQPGEPALPAERMRGFGEWAKYVTKLLEEIHVS